MSFMSRCRLAGVAATLALWAVAGAAQEPGTRPLVLNGFSLTPPPGWQGQRGPAAVVFGRMVDEHPAKASEPMPRQTFMIMARMERAPLESLASAAALEQFVLERILVPSRDRRQQIVSRHTEPLTVQGTDCVRFRMVLEEKPRGDVLLLTGAGIVCRHPEAPGQAVHASYSVRHVKGDDVGPADAEIAAAEAVLQSLAFTPVR
jgi:hypothetical protein